VPHFDQISQSTADILLLPVYENKRPPYSNSTFDFDLIYSLPSACDSAVACRILYKLDDRRRSYDVILILQDSGHTVTNLHPVSVFATSDFYEGLELCTYQTSTEYPNQRPKYYYRGSRKTNGRHIEILLPVSIFTFSL